MYKAINIYGKYGKIKKYGNTFMNRKRTYHIFLPDDEKNFSRVTNNKKHEK